jgi:HSP90 family molecular chaperone
MVDKQEPSLSQFETREFKAETKKLLDIVAKNIYTDKEVFLRELLSNCSDALEKQRFAEITGQNQGSGDPEGLYIKIVTNAKDRTLTIFDSGIGMSRDEIVENLGTIAKSGSQDFKNMVMDSHTGDDQSADSIIG